MLDLNHKATVNVEGTSVGAEKALKTIVKHAKELEAQLEKVNKTSAAGSKESSGLGASFQKLDNFLGSTAGKLTGLGVGATAAFAALKTLASGIVELADASLKASNAVGNIPFSLDAAKKATHGLISEMDLALAASKAQSFGLAKNGEEFAKLAAQGQQLGARMGLDAKQGIDDWTTALGRQSMMILDNFGIILKVEEAQEIYAGSLGKTVKELTEAEKKQAFANAALIKAEPLLNNVYQETEGLAASLKRASIAWTDYWDSMLSSDEANQRRMMNERREELENLSNEELQAIIDFKNASTEQRVAQMRVEENYYRELGIKMSGFQGLQMKETAATLIANKRKTEGLAKLDEAQTGVNEKLKTTVDLINKMRVDKFANMAKVMRGWGDNAGATREEIKSVVFQIANLRREGKSVEADTLAQKDAFERMGALGTTVMGTMTDKVKKWRDGNKEATGSVKDHAKAVEELDKLLGEGAEKRFDKLQEENARAREGAAEMLAAEEGALTLKRQQLEQERELKALQFEGPTSNAADEFSAKKQLLDMETEAKAKMLELDRQSLALKMEDPEFTAHEMMAEEERIAHEEKMNRLNNEMSTKKLLAERNKKLHEQNKKLLEDEKKDDKKAKDQKKKNWETALNAMENVGQAMDGVFQLMGNSQDNLTKKEAAMLGIQLGYKALYYSIKAAAAFAAQNYVEGAGNVIAAGIATAGAIKLAIKGGRGSSEVSAPSMPAPPKNVEQENSGVRGGFRNSDQFPSFDRFPSGPAQNNQFIIYGKPDRGFQTMIDEAIRKNQENNRGYRS